MITTVINYCSSDEKFIHKNIVECLKFSDEVVISCVDHFFNGIEDKNLYESLKEYFNHPKIKIVLSKWDSKLGNNCQHYWHNVCRYVAYLQTKNSGYYLFLDADEIPNGDLFKKYLNTKKYLNYDIIGDFISYYYFDKPIYRSLVLSGVGLLINSTYIIQDHFMRSQERWFYRKLNQVDYDEYDLRYPRICERVSFNGIFPKIINFNGKFAYLELGEVMFHHYSWVRSKQEMLAKVNSWGHKYDCDWTSMVENYFNVGFNGKCFVHGWEYIEVDNFLETI